MPYFHQNSCSIKYFSFLIGKILFNNATLTQEIQARQQRETTKKVSYIYDNLPSNKKKKNNKNTKQWLKVCITSPFLKEQAIQCKHVSARNNHVMPKPRGFQFYGVNLEQTSPFKGVSFSFYLVFV